MDIVKPQPTSVVGSVGAKSFRGHATTRHHHTQSKVSLVQRAVHSPHFNIYVDNETPPMELAVPPGRQNCFMAIIYFLYCTEKFEQSSHKSHSGSAFSGRSSSLPPALRDLYVDVFGEVS